MSLTWCCVATHPWTTPTSIIIPHLNTTSISASTPTSWLFINLFNTSCSPEMEPKSLKCFDIFLWLKFSHFLPCGTWRNLTWKSKWIETMENLHTEHWWWWYIVCFLRRGNIQIGQTWNPMTSPASTWIRCLATSSLSWRPGERSVYMVCPTRRYSLWPVCLQTWRAILALDAVWN